MKTKLVLSAFLLCSVFLTYGQWSYTNLFAPRAYMGATSLGSKAYFAGGMNESALLSTVEIYDASTGVWDTTQHLSVARDLITATTCGSKVLFAGGVDFFSTGNCYATVDIFDTQTQQWSVAQLSAPRFNICAMSHGNKVLFAGGINTQLGIAYDIVDIYNCETGEWSVTHLSGPRVAYGGVVNDLGILPGGFDSEGVTKRVDIYNFTTNTWSIDSLSVARAWVGVATVGDKMLIAGGAIDGNIQSNVVDIYNATSGTWDTAHLSLPRSFADNQNAVTACGKAYFVGGGIMNLNGPYWDSAYNRIDIYDPVTHIWTVDSLPGTDASVHRATVSFGNQFINAGGVWYGYTSDAEIYTCPTSGCLPEGITFTTQEQIDNFQANHPGCTEIEGDVTISGYNISNLNGLNVLTSIGGTLWIGINNGGNHMLTSLTGLENLIYIGGNLHIGGSGLAGPHNPALTSLTGLDNMTSIGGDLKIYNNPALTSLNGLEGLTSIGGDLFIHDNGNLTSCAAQGICDFLTSPNSVVDIYENGPGCNSQSEVASACGNSISCLPYGNYYFLSQTDIDNFQINFPGCTELEGNFTIIGDSITNLTSLNQVFSIGGNAEIKNCDNLASLSGLNNLSNVGGDIYLFHNESLINLSGLENLSSIGGSLAMYENNQLLSLSGLENLDSIGGWLSVGTIYQTGVPDPPPGGNDLLVSLSSLASLTYVGGGIDIGKNNSLLSLAGLENINANTVTDLLIGNNNSLSSCDVQSVCDYLSSPNGTIIIEFNAPGCNSPEEVQAACAVSISEVGSQQSAVRCFPNPADKSVTIATKKGTTIEEVVIYTQTGQKVLQGKPVNQTLDISKLQPGMYIVELGSGQWKVRKKLMVQ